MFRIVIFLAQKQGVGGIFRFGFISVDKTDCVDYSPRLRVGSALRLGRERGSAKAAT